MKTDIEFAQDVTLGEAKITSIHVESLTFFTMAKLWKGASKLPGKPNVVLQRARIQHQAHFLDADKKRHVPTPEEMYQLPAAVGKAIADALDIGQGTTGEIILEGDGSVKPIVYKLGVPISAKMNGKNVEINELEFQASTFGQIEDILASDSEMDRACALITGLAVPLEIEGLMQLPAWAIDQMSTADGVAIMRKVLPAF